MSRPKLGLKSGLRPNRRREVKFRLRPDSRPDLGLDMGLRLLT